MELVEKAAILWREGFIPDLLPRKDWDQSYMEMVERRWTLKEKVPQIGAKQAKEQARNRHIEDETD